MPRKTIIIFIVVFILVGAGMLGFYYLNQPEKVGSGTSKTGSGYKPFGLFGRGDSDTDTDTTTQNNGDTGEIVVPAGASDVGVVPVFHKITEFAVAGAVFFEDTRPLPQIETTEPIDPKKKKTPQPTFEIVPALRYVERMTGHIYEMYLDNKTTSKISNSTIPSIYEAIFSGKADSVIYRYLADDNVTITSFMATLGASQGEFLPSNITDITLSPDKSKFFYITESANAVTGTTRAFLETKKAQVFTSPFTEWLSQWVGPTKVYLTTKASYSAKGDLYALNTTSGTLSKVLGGVSGLTTLSNAIGTKVLYSKSQVSGPRLLLLDPSTHTSSDTGYTTLPEKCVWSIDNVTVYCAVPNSISGSEYPDSWYQGKVSFDDTFIKINTATNDAQTIANSSDETSVDATRLFLNKDESALFFINKKDGTLWQLDLK